MITRKAFSWSEIPRTKSKLAMLYPRKRNESLELPPESDTTDELDSTGYTQNVRLRTGLLPFVVSAVVAGQSSNSFVFFHVAVALPLVGRYRVWVFYNL